MKEGKKKDNKKNKSRKQSSLLTSPLANVSLGGGSLIQQHHPHGDCSIWDKVVKETTHSHTGEEEAGTKYTLPQEKLLDTHTHTLTLTLTDI